MQAADLLNRLGEIRRSQIETVRHVVSHEPDLGLRIADCGSWLHLREWLDHEGETTLKNANFCCKHILCEACAIRRSLKLWHAYLAKVGTVLQERPELIPAHVTLTWPNTPTVPIGRDIGGSAWEKMIAARRKGRSSSCRHKAIEWCKVEGSVKATECTFDANGWAHVHYHVFVLLSEYIEQPKLSAEWEAFGAGKVVGVRKCDSIEKGLVEVLKYATKFNNGKERVDPRQLWAVFDAFRGKRMTDPQGCLRGVPEPDLNEADDDSAFRGRFRDLYAIWQSLKGSYKLQLAGEGVQTEATPPAFVPEPPENPEDPF